MDCQETRLALTDDPDEPPAAVRTHLAECGPCRDVADAARDGLAVARAEAREAQAEDVPPLDVESLLRRAVPRERRRLPVLRLAARAAAVLLAAVGVLALFGSRVEAAEGTVRVSFALPGAAAPASTPDPSTPDEGPAVADVLRALDPDDPESAVRRAMGRGLVPLAEWLDEREARDVERLDEIVALVRGAQHEDLLALRAELRAIRREFDVSRHRLAALAPPPALPSAD
jgi:hypothetical protein